MRIFIDSILFVKGSKLTFEDVEVDLRSNEQKKASNGKSDNHAAGLVANAQWNNKRLQSNKGKGKFEVNKPQVVVTTDNIDERKCFYYKQLGHLKKQCFTLKRDNRNVKYQPNGGTHNANIVETSESYEDAEVLSISETKSHNE